MAVVAVVAVAAVLLVRWQPHLILSPVQNSSTEKQSLGASPIIDDLGVMSNNSRWVLM